MSISHQQRVAASHHGLYLVPNTGHYKSQLQTAVAYRIAIFAAALFLVMTVC